MHRKLITANSSHYIQLIRARSQRSHTSSTLNESDAGETSRRAGAPEGTSLGIRPAQPHSKRKHNHFHIFQNWHRWKRRPCAPPFAINLIAKSIIWSVLEKRSEKNKPVWWLGKPKRFELFWIEWRETLWSRGPNKRQNTWLRLWLMWCKKKVDKSLQICSLQHPWQLHPQWGA